MIKPIRYVLALALGLSVAQASADNSFAGSVDYISPATLEIGISGQLYKLDNNTQIQGTTGADLVQRMNSLAVGMQVRGERSSSSTIRVLSVVPE